mmetsp:Transcript_17863/g.38281  ORF Transcript_17863/g.38281 Transcript_17863/m.38281 type:complete len:140 (-) Transcript_17863:283-702(-)
MACRLVVWRLGGLGIWDRKGKDTDDKKDESDCERSSEAEERTHTTRQDQETSTRRHLMTAQHQEAGVDKRKKKGRGMVLEGLNRGYLGSDIILQGKTLQLVGEQLCFIGTFGHVQKISKMMKNTMKSDVWRGTPLPSVL